MAGLDPAIHVFLRAGWSAEIHERPANIEAIGVPAAWMAGSSPAMTELAGLAGHG
jgi:hypothetical protein